MLQKIKGITIIFIVFIFSFSSCSEYQKLLKSSDYVLKLEKAIEYYEDQDYLRSITLFEELLIVYKGTNKAEEIYYYYAYSHYGQKDFVLAGHYFRSFVSTFPVSEHREEAEYLSAYCYYLDSPSSSLDQTYTRKAIEEMQAFINAHSESERISEANDIIDKLYGKLEEKSYNSAKLYYDLGYYKAAITALENSLKEYPDSKFREETKYLKLESNFLLASNSIKSKQEERFQSTITEFKQFKTQFPESEKMEDAQKIYDKSLKMIDD